MKKNLTGVLSSEKNTIPNNRAALEQLHPAIRDLVVLLAEIEYRRLMQAKLTTPGQLREKKE